MSIAGYDPSGGAGSTLDIRVFEQLGFRGFGVLTAVTAQNTSRVTKVFPLPPSMVKRQFETLIEEHEPAGLKVGMTGSSENVPAVRYILRHCAGIPRVIDPILRSTSGMSLTGARSTSKFLAALSGAAELITPNIEEAGILAGLTIDGPDGMRQAAEVLFERTGVPCLVKGGRRGFKMLDVLYDGSDFHEFRHDRLSKNVHGTGCFLSAAILAFLVMGKGLREACAKGIEMTEKAIGTAPGGADKRTSFSFPC